MPKVKVIKNEDLLFVWGKHVKYISTRLDSQQVWAYYKQQLAEAKKRKLEDALYEICIHYVHWAMFNKPIRKAML